MVTAYTADALCDGESTSIDVRSRLTTGEHAVVHHCFMVPTLSRYIEVPLLRDGPALSPPKEGAEAQCNIHGGNDDPQELLI